ncbi:MAG: arsenate reductase ArsC [Candidatus Marinimicrobia bacterium]|nr:arsenate reductase ArsC [Candidatus Neomarinimicrobiota bacterium]
MKILVLCTGNSCRSQMAHGFLNHFNNEMEVYSAGVHPAYRVQPETIEVMAEKGIDISAHTPEHVYDYLKETFDYVITVCDHANETCPIFSGEVKHRLHMPFPDPIHARGGIKKRLAVYREIRDMIEEKFYAFYKEEIEPEL